MSTLTVAVKRRLHPSHVPVHDVGAESSTAQHAQRASRTEETCVQVQPDHKFRQCVTCRHWRILMPAAGEDFADGEEFDCAKHPDTAKRRQGCPAADDDVPTRAPTLLDVKRSPDKPRKRHRRSHPPSAARSTHGRGRSQKRRRRGACAVVEDTSLDSMPTLTAQHVPCPGSTQQATGCRTRRLVLCTIAELVGDYSRVEELRELRDADFASMSDLEVAAQVAALRRFGGLPDAPQCMAIADGPGEGAEAAGPVATGLESDADVGAAARRGRRGRTEGGALRACMRDSGRRQYGASLEPCGRVRQALSTRHAARSLRAPVGGEESSMESSQPSASSSEGSARDEPGSESEEASGEASSGSEAGLEQVSEGGPSSPSHDRRCDGDGSSTDTSDAGSSSDDC